MGSKVEGISVISPKELLERRMEYDVVVIASMYYKEVKATLDAIGFTEKDYIVYE